SDRSHPTRGLCRSFTGKSWEKIARHRKTGLVSPAMRSIFYKSVHLAFALGLAALIPGCGKSKTEGDSGSRVETGNRDQVLHLGNKAEPQDLDLHIIEGVGEHNIVSALFESLVTEDPKTLEPVPGVAEHWEVSPDGLVYTFHLRPNAKWS